MPRYPALERPCFPRAAQSASVRASSRMKRIALEELNRDLCSNRAAVDSWAQAKLGAAEDLRDQHVQTLRQLQGKTLLIAGQLSLSRTYDGKCKLGVVPHQQRCVTRAALQVTSPAWKPRKPED